MTYVWYVRDPEGMPVEYSDAYDGLYDPDTACDDGFDGTMDDTFVFRSEQDARFWLDHSRFAGANRFGVERCDLDGTATLSDGATATFDRDAEQVVVSFPNGVRMRVTNTDPFATWFIMNRWPVDLYTANYWADDRHIDAETAAGLKAEGIVEVGY